MSVLSDITIHQLCVPPTHVIETHRGAPDIPVWAYVTHTEEQMDRYGEHLVKLTEDHRLVRDFKPMITPFIPESIKRVDDEAVASFGLSSFGYDIRAAAEFKVFRGMTRDGRIDYKNIDDSMFETVRAPDIWIPPNSFILTRSVERVKIPKDVLALCIGKSTIARAGINCLCTPLEPDWEGYITLEFANSTSLPNRFYAGEGCLQLVFLRGDQQPRTTYGQRPGSGKYNHQDATITLPRV